MAGGRRPAVRPWRWHGLALSVAVHAVILVTAYLNGILDAFLPIAPDPVDWQAEQSPVVIKFTGRTTLPDGREAMVDIPMTPQAIKEYIIRRAGDLRGVSIVDIQDRLADLNGKVAPASVDEIIAWFDLGGFETGDAQAAAVPAQFDYRTMTFYAIDRKVFPDGPGFVIAWIDRQGVLMETDFPPGMVTPEVTRLYDIFALVKANPMLEKLYRGIVVKILGEMMSGTEPGRPASAGDGDGGQPAVLPTAGPGLPASK
ncbi:MAG: hypothetical protein ABIF71_04060 [Planctomycetota bacterium]